MDVITGWRVLAIGAPGFAAAVALFMMLFYPEVLAQLIVEHAERRAQQLVEWIYPQLELSVPNTPSQR